jgi:hypothetical protein
MALVRMHLVTIAVATMLAAPSSGAVFSCDEAGLDAAIRAGGPGPHTFNCAGPTVIPVTSNKNLLGDITLDGGGLVTFDGGGGNARTWRAIGFGAQQELRDLDLIGLGFEIKRGTELTLRRVHLAGYNPPLPFGIVASVILESDLVGSIFGTLNLIESAIEDNSTCAVWGPLG